MRFLRALPFLLTFALVYLLDKPIGTLPALGRLLDPVNGALAAAERVDEDFNKNLKLSGLKSPVDIWWEDRLVPHIRAQNDHDLYYTQGYIHAYHRLWQMDMQTRGAAGRVSEVAGPKAIEYDRGQRRKGMVYGAKASLATMEADPRTKLMLDAYRDGINTYIHSLNYRSLPIEYKLMGFRPEDWTNLRTSLMAKNLADDLTSKTDDIAYTMLRDQLGHEQFDFLFPEKIKGSKPVIPEGTPFAKPSLPIPKVPDGDIWSHFNPHPAFPQSGGGGVGKDKLNFTSNQNPENPSQYVTFPALGEGRDGGESAIGSNNWAISGKHTASGKPILCNDPHLSLNLPSLWYEMQLTAPGINTYGASLPGAPGIVIGFNEKVSWGFTNNYRDVKDFYEISTTNSFYPKKEGGEKLPLTSYLFCGNPLPFQTSIEVIKVKNQPDVIDTVLYTLHGPVNYDPSFPDPAKSGKLLACTWMAHRGSNELLATYLLNRAGDYPAFTDAIKYFECPAQNIAYADGAGNIAMWGQGRFINKWKGQGKYVMKGRDSSTLWGESIPMEENPHVLNPPQGYVASANQSLTDSTYPYWYNGSFVEWRSWQINNILKDLLTYKASIYPNDDEEKWSTHTSKPPLRLGNVMGMQELQNVCSSPHQNIVSLAFSLEPYDSLANARFSDRYSSAHDDSVYFLFDNDLSALSSMGTKIQVSSYFFQRALWQDEFPRPATKYPSSELTMQLLLSDSTSNYFDDKRTQKVETFRDIVRRAFRETTDSLEKLKATTGLEWYKVKNTTLTHLAKLPAFSYSGLKIGGWNNTINAVTDKHGPSWRMIVEMDSIPQAYVVYPGGQSGNPGSPHYGDFINHWVEGKYFSTQFLTAATTKNPFKYTWTITP